MDQLQRAVLTGQQGNVTILSHRPRYDSDTTTGIPGQLSHKTNILSDLY